MRSINLYLYCRGLSSLKSLTILPVLLGLGLKGLIMSQKKLTLLFLWISFEKREKFPTNCIFFLLALILRNPFSPVILFKKLFQKETNLRKIHSIFFETFLFLACSTDVGTRQGVGPPTTPSSTALILSS